MSLETALYGVLYAVCPRVTPDTADFGTARPYITWQQIGGPALVYVEGALPAERAAWVQINCWADTRLAANTLMLQVEAALVAAGTLSARPLGALQASHDDDTELCGSQQDFEIWADR